VLLADGSVPAPVFFDMGSGGGGQAVSRWSTYDGRYTHVPRAAALRAVCSCGWTGLEHELHWDQIGNQTLAEATGSTADTCTQDWNQHTAQVQQSAIPLPEAFTNLLAQVVSEIETLGKTCPLAALRAARQLEVTAVQTAYWPAHEAHQDATLEQAATALGLDEDAARKLMARFGDWSPYR
jgi:hypothetical protein